jgi:hypothetical protein
MGGGQRIRGTLSEDCNDRGGNSRHDLPKEKSKYSGGGGGGGGQVSIAPTFPKLGAGSL